MSKIVTIPTDGMNPFVVTHNGEKYVFAPGETVEVSDGVALEIEEYKRWREKYYGTIDPPYEGGGSGGSSNESWIGDGNTHIWISLQEGRTSPMLGVCPNGTVTVDWGDDTTPDVLTGTNTSAVKWTPNHEYAKPGDYVITLTVDGEIGINGSASANILRHTSSSDKRNAVYQNAIQKVEIGDDVTSIDAHAFSNCCRLSSITIPNSVTYIGGYAFYYCYSLPSITIPDSVTSIQQYAFYNCRSLSSITIPNSVTSIDNNVFNSCSGLSSITFPNGVTSIGDNVLNGCSGLSSITIPNSVTYIAKAAFQLCSGVRYYDFTRLSAVPTLSAISAFAGIADDCEIRVPSALYDEWVAETNWTTYADKIVAV